MLEGFTPANATFPPQRILAYGVQGIGKNTFATTFEKPVIIQTEEGSHAFDVPASPVASVFQDVVDSIQRLHGEHGFKTVILDSLDWLEPLTWAACCAQNNWESIESPGWGKGYIELDRWWRYVMVGLDSLRMNKGMTVIVLAHSQIKTISPPDTDAYDTYQIKMQRRAFDLWQEWADMVLFLNYKVNVQKTKVGVDQVKVRGVGTGERVIYTNERPAYKAKNRWGLPDEIIIGKDKTFTAFHQALEACTDGRYVSPIAPVATATTKITNGK